MALPSLPRDAPLRRCLDRVVESLADLGLEVEAFAEMARVREGAEVPLFHYLRFDERHRAAPFRSALWPLGRDVRTWEPAWILSRRFPGTAWVLDEPLHHAAVGGIAIPGHWGLYGRLLGEALDDADPVFSLFAAGWASRAAYRVHDPMRRRVRDQGRVLRAISGDGGQDEAAVPEPVPLPAVFDASEEAPAGDARVAIISVDVIRPGDLMAGLGEVLAPRPDLDVSIAVPEPTYHVRVAPAAHDAGIAERVRWLLSPGSTELIEELRRASVALFLDVDLNAGDRALLAHGLGLGKASLAMDVPQLRDMPDPPLLKLRPGAALGPGLAVALRGLLDDRGLREALGAAARRWYRERPGARAIARRLAEHLADAPAPEVDRRPREDGPWRSLRREMLEDCPASTSVAGSRKRVEELLDDVLPEGRGGASTGPRS